MLSHDAMPFMTHEKHFFGMFDGMMAAERIGTGGNVAGGNSQGSFTLELRDGIDTAVEENSWGQVKAEIAKP
jgi:hypothetical protein